MSDIRRRRLLLAAGAMLTAPLALAQAPARKYRVGVLLASAPGLERYRAALVERLASHGFVESRNLQIDARGSAGIFHEDRDTARAMLAAKADALFTFANRPTQAALSATKSVPVVFTWVGDPIAAAIVKNYARPGGNATGVTTRFGELLVKRAELVRDLLPRSRRIAVLFWKSDEAFPALAPALRNVAAQLGIELLEIDISSWDTALDHAVKSGAEAVLPFWQFGASPVSADVVIQHANRLRVPVVFAEAEPVDRGGLISWGTNLVDDVRRGADMLARVLKGAKPADLPVDQAARFELVVNLKTAKAIGLSISQTVLLRADRVIE